jgi:hypothetical protein
MIVFMAQMRNARADRRGRSVFFCETDPMTGEEDIVTGIASRGPSAARGA